MINTHFFKSTLKQGILMGVFFCLYTTLMWLTELDTTYLNIGQYLDMLIIFLPITMIFWAIRQERNSYSVTILQRISITIFVGAVSYLIYQPYLYAYHTYINPDWFDSVLTLKDLELKASNTPPDQISETLEKMKGTNASQSGIYSFSSAVVSVFILPTLIALISLIFIRRKK